VGGFLNGCFRNFLIFISEQQTLAANSIFVSEFFFLLRSLRHADVVEELHDEDAQTDELDVVDGLDRGGMLYGFVGYGTQQKQVDDTD